MTKTGSPHTTVLGRFPSTMFSLAFAVVSSALTLSTQAGLYAPPAAGGPVFVTNQKVNTVPGPGGFGVVSGPTAFPGIAFDPQGNLYVANSQANTITKYSAGNGGSLFVSGLANGLNNPTGLAFDSAGNLFVANYGNDTIWKFNSSGVGMQFTATGLNKPNGLAFDTAGNLFAANSNNSISKFTASGSPLAPYFNANLNVPVGLAFDSSDNLFVSNVAGNSIVKFDTMGMGSVFASNVPTPVGLAFDSNGNLYVGENTGNLVEKYNPSNASHSLFADCGLGGTANLAFAPYSLVAVPEPATFSVGFLCVGAAVVRRRRATAAA